MNTPLENEEKVKKHYLSLINVKANLLVLLEELIIKLEKNEKQLAEMENGVDLSKIEVEENVAKNQ